MAVKLFSEKNTCCGCTACMNICPKHAITMVKDEEGFLYPVINQEKCVECGLCKKVCAFQSVKRTGRHSVMFKYGLDFL